MNRTMRPVLAVACDMPLLTFEAVRWLAEIAGERRLRHGLATVIGQHLEPMFSVYTPASRSLISDHIAKGELSLRGLIEAGQFDRVEAPAWLTGCLRNVNSPGDLAEVEHRLGLGS